ncbi:MAG: biosynthetic arginine decarboxylase, partial [Sulfurimonas sp.]
MYGIDIWGDNNFFIDNESIRVNYRSAPTLLEITQNIRESGIRGPLLLRFPHLIQKQIDSLYEHFHRAIEENEYQGTFHAVFPLKVNPFPNVIDTIIAHGKTYGYGLEAGSKAELVLAISKTPLGSPITVNGFKDTEMITMGFIAAQMGHDITLIIEGINELESIIEVHATCHLKTPSIGIRLRLHSGGSGTWAKSGGMRSKFGLTTTEILEAMHLLKSNGLLDSFTMIHFHIGSQMEEISPLKKALREAGNIYAELKMMGADKLSSINIGGGLAVEYSQRKKERKNYSLNEFSNDVIFSLREIMNAKGVEHPNIYTESGRYIVASHATLIAPVLELFSHDYQERSLRFKKNNPPLIDELRDLNRLLNAKNCIEFMHDALDHQESLLTLFDLGYIDLEDRSNSEILVHLIIKKSLYLMASNPTNESIRLEERFVEHFLINGSIFQSLPDYWGLNQKFPVMPLSKLNIKPIRAANLWDITCDSDGEITFDSQAPLYLHDIDLDNEEYFLAFFNI